MSDRQKIQEPSEWDAALIAASSLAWNFHRHLGESIFAFLIRGMVKAIGAEIARQILELKIKPMPPLHPLLKNDGPACRVCGCTEHNACVQMATVKLTPEQKRERWSPMAVVPCSWVRTEHKPDDIETPLCSSCAGTAEDLAEAMVRITKILDTGSRHAGTLAHRIAVAAIARRKKLKKST